jgi:hypothetical protein
MVKYLSFHNSSFALIGKAIVWDTTCYHAGQTMVETTNVWSCSLHDSDVDDKKFRRFISFGDVYPWFHFSWKFAKFQPENLDLDHLYEGIFMKIGSNSTDLHKEKSLNH